MLVKSSNKDPRFGETTYELTNIDRNVPSPALFQVPADCTTHDTDKVLFEGTVGGGPKAQ
jgi:hypothetical protein